MPTFRVWLVPGPLALGLEWPNPHRPRSATVAPRIPIQPRWRHQASGRAIESEKCSHGVGIADLGLQLFGRSGEGQ
jgi:hypothetical protein